MKRVAIFISGSGSNMVKLVQSMVDDHPARPVLILSNNPNASGLDRAREMGIDAVSVDHKPFGNDRDAFEDELKRIIAPYDIDILCLAGFMRILTNGFVRNWEGRMLNIHPSLLPKYKGLNTHTRAIEAKDEWAGCSVHLVTEKLDDGPVLGQAKVPILVGDTFDSLAQRVLEKEHILYPQVLKRFCLNDKTPIFI